MSGAPPLSEPLFIISPQHIAQCKACY